jgi:hypothetical protein
MAAEKGKNQEIKQFLAVLASAILSAALLTYFFISNFGPTGRYVAGYAMLDPSIVDNIDLRDHDPRTGKSLHFVFDSFAFSFFDPQARSDRTVLVSRDAYGQFYAIVSSEASLELDSADLQGMFSRSRPALLTASVRADTGPNQGTTKVFQAVELIPEDYFRVQLKGEKDGEWAYFYRPRVFEDARAAFTGRASS